MSDALPLPPHPQLEHYKKLAKDCQRACLSDKPSAIEEWAHNWAARLLRLRTGMFPAEAEAETQRDVERVKRQWASLPIAPKRKRKCLLADAQFFVARCHGFASWQKFVDHIQSLGELDSPNFRFEAAVDAIVQGDLERLAELLGKYPALVRQRSKREHNSTLLHYVSANGVEDFRQKSPANIVAMARLLLESGADVNAESNAYGGRATTLGLTATSVHPETAGVQDDLMALLVASGAAVDRPDGGSAVVDCLRNGRGQAAVQLARDGAFLNLEGAAGVGRLDVVQASFQGDGSLKPPATPEQLRAGFAWACEFGRDEVVEFLLRQRLGVDAPVPHHGGTGLHWAAFGGHASTSKILLDGGASVTVRDASYGGTPLEWAIYAWGGAAGHGESDYYQTVRLLARAGAALMSGWFDGDDPQRRLALEKLQADPRMQAAIGWNS